MAGDSQATFSLSVKNAIHGTYDYRCVICLALVRTSRCAHIIDVATPGLQQLRNAVELGVLAEDYKRNAETNGMVQCPSCHTYFTNNYVVLSLPIPVLKYLETYVASTPKANRKPLHEVFNLLVDASHRTPVELPSAKAISPYLGLFTMLTINPTTVAGFDIQTPHLPSLSIIRGTKFVKAPPNTSATADKVARIFEPLALNNNTPRSYGRIPLSAQDQDFMETRYWRLPVPAAAIFAALIERLANDSSGCEDIRLAKNIRSILDLQSRDAYPPDQNDGGGSTSGGGGPCRGDNWLSKRKDAGNKTVHHLKDAKRRVKKHPVATGLGIVVKWVLPLRPFGNVDFSLGSLSQNGQSKHQETVSSTRTLDDEAPIQLIDTGSDDSDLDGGRSISAISPHDQDNPDEWRFGPTFTTNKIIFAARAVNLT